MAELGLLDTAGREFRLVRVLGTGGFGTVHLAECQSSGGLVQRVALKLLHADLQEGSQAIERMRDEALLLSRLRHPVIVTAHDLVQFGDGRIGLVTEYVDGQDLTGCLADPIPLRSVAEIGSLVASALHEAWTALGIVHRDVKPGNIRLGRHGTVKLLDFGIARSAAVARSARTRTDAMIGTLGYLAPEQFDGGEPQPSADVFALGCVLFEATFGVPLLDLGMAELARLSISRPAFDAHLDARFARETARPLPPELLALIRASVAYLPADRPTAEELAVRCDVAAPALPGPSLRGWCRSRSWPHLAVDGPLPTSLETRFERTTPPSGNHGRTETLDPDPDPEPISASTSRPSRTWPVVAGALLGGSTMGLAAVGVVAFALLAWATWPRTPVEPAAPAPAPVVEVAPAPEVAPPPEVALAPASPKVAPVAPSPPRAPQPAPIARTAPPIPVEPAVAVPPPAPEPAPTAQAPAPTWSVMIASRPLGGLVVVDGVRAGTTPVMPALSAGWHTLEINLGADVSQTRVLVGKNTPRTYTWSREGDAWESGY